MNYDLTVDLSKDSSNTWQACHIQTGLPDLTVLAIKIDSKKENSDGTNEFEITHAQLDFDGEFLEISEMRLANAAELKNINDERISEGHLAATIALKVFVKYDVLHRQPKVFTPASPLLIKTNRTDRLDINLNPSSDSEHSERFIKKRVGPKICTFRTVW